MSAVITSPGRVEKQIRTDINGKPRFIVYFLAAACLTVLSATLKEHRAPLGKLSDYGFFEGPVAAQQPAKGTRAYRLNTPLFSDNALKLRFVRLPEGGTVPYNDSSVFEFPVGTAIVKTFYYPSDMRNPSKGRRLMETRVLLHEPSGWKALPYVWNEDQTDALLDVAGVTTEVSYVDEDGRKRKHPYYVPNMNQCKGCHNRGEKIHPIGPSARQLSGPLESGQSGPSQLDEWSAAGLLVGLPPHGQRPTVVVWNDPATGTVEQRARLWLDINCAHCHDPKGPASTSGLFLGIRETEPLRLGQGKSPVAAGRASAGMAHDIEQGKPESSILVHRMASVDPGVMMPELGRTQPDPAAVALVSEWIKGLK
jgi:uncharacterized repeat protein (TIGR03806 family)